MKVIGTLPKVTVNGAISKVSVHLLDFRQRLSQASNLIHHHIQTITDIAVRFNQCLPACVADQIIYEFSLHGSFEADK